MRKTLILIGVLLLVALPLSAQWHSDFRVTNNTGSSYTPYPSGGWGIAADDGDVYITWYDYTLSPYYIRYHSFPIGTPSQTANGEQVSTTYGYYPIVSAFNGKPFVSWYYSVSPYYLFTRIKDGSWGTIMNHGIANMSCYYPATAFDASGNLHCVFNRYSSTSGDARGYSVWYQRLNSGSTTWTTPVMVFDPHADGGSASSYYYSYRPTICVTSDGAIHVAVGTSYNYTLKHCWSTNNGANWSYETLTPVNTCYYTYEPSICHDSEDNLYIAYVTYPSPYHINVISGTTGEWNSPEQVDASTYSYVYYPSICCDTSNNIWVCWDDRSGQTYEIYYNRMNGQTGLWDGPQALTANDGQYSRAGQLAADANGNVHICWYDNRDNNYEIYYNWYSSGGSGPGGDRDLACTRILQPVGKIPNESIEPQAVIANLGENVDSGYAKCFITGPGTNYNKGNLEGIVYLDPGQEKQVTFPDWVPTGAPGDKYRIEVVVYLWPEKTIADYDSTNNTKVEYATIASGTQVVATTITMPDEGATIDRMKPAAYFTNVGTEPAVNFYCHCDITPGSTTLAYLDSVGVSDTLQPGDSTFIEFAEWTSLDETPFTADFYVSGVDGAVRSVIFNGIPWVGVGEKPDLYCFNLSISGASISFSIPKAGNVTLKVYDASGKLVSTLLEGTATRGVHSFNLNTHSGVYFVKLVTPDYSAVRKVVIF